MSNLKKTVFNDFGCEILELNKNYFIRYDSGEAAGSAMKTHAITIEEAAKAMLSEKDAYEVILACQNRNVIL